MPRKSQKLRITKYLLAALAATLLILWTCSIWLRISWTNPPATRSFTVQAGRLEYDELDTISRVLPTGWEISRSVSPIQWNYGFADHYAAIPLWFLIAVVSFAAAIAAWLDAIARRRVEVGSCTRCGYQQTGLPPDSGCPECGIKSSTD